MTRGAYLLGALGDYVWVDADKDGIQDEGEQPVEGIIVTLQQRFDEGEWETVGTAVTDENGFYQFTGLKSSEHYEVEYRVVFDISLLLSITKPEQGNDKAVDSNALYDYVLNLGYPTAPVTLGYGQSDMTLDAGIIYDEDLCEIGDFVWYDKDQDGIQDTGEEGVEGIRVLLQYCESGIIWEDDEWWTVAETTTNAEGRYLFAGLPSGYYRVGFAVGDPWTVTLTNIGEDTAVDSNATRNLDGYYFSTGFYMNAGESDMTWDAGIYRIDEKPVITQTVIQQIIQGGQHFVQGVFTGDPKCIAGLVGLLGASAAVMIFILSQRRRKKNYEK